MLADHVRSSPLLLSSARATAAAGQQVATDGGRVESGESTENGDDSDDDPETCDHCGGTADLKLTDMSDVDWNDFAHLCETCLLEVGGPGEAPDDAGTVDVSPCPGCGAPTTGDTCGRARCEGADEINEVPL